MMSTMVKRMEKKKKEFLIVKKVAKRFLMEERDTSGHLRMNKHRLKELLSLSTTPKNERFVALDRSEKNTRISQMSIWTLIKKEKELEHFRSSCSRLFYLFEYVFQIRSDLQMDRLASERSLTRNGRE